MGKKSQLENTTIIIIIVISRLLELPFSFSSLVFFFSKTGQYIVERDTDKLSTTTTLLVALVTAAAVILSALTNRNMCGCDISFDYIVVKETEKKKPTYRKRERETRGERERESKFQFTSNTPLSRFNRK